MVSNILLTRGTWGKSSKLRGKCHLDHNGTSMTCPFGRHTEKGGKQKEQGELGSEVTVNCFLFNVLIIFPMGKWCSLVHIQVDRYSREQVGRGL